MQVLTVAVSEKDFGSIFCDRLKWVSIHTNEKPQVCDIVAIYCQLDESGEIDNDRLILREITHVTPADEAGWSYDGWVWEIASLGMLMPNHPAI